MSAHLSSRIPLTDTFTVPEVAVQLVGRVRTVARVLFTALKKTDPTSELTYMASPPYTLLRRL